MPIIRRLIAQHDERTQILKVDCAKRYLQNESRDWQFLFGPNSALSSGTRVLKISAQLDTESLNKIKLIAYLYNPITGNADGAATCTFNVYRVTTPGWVDSLIGSFLGSMQTNSYFYAEQVLTYFNPAEMDGDSSLMIEVVITRLSETFRDRIYLNHLGIYESVIRLRQDVEFLDITKLDE